jgi:predicted dehydrogenase
MTVRWGIIGAGDIARKQTAQAIRATRSARLMAVMRRDLEAARAFAQEFGAAKAYGRVDEVLADPEIDAVYIATPVGHHAEQTIAAAHAGKHVLVEKPMAMSTVECRDMILACRQHGVKLMVCYYQRFNARHIKVRELVAQGAIGQVTMAQARQVFLYPPAPGLWRQSPEQAGGGALMDVGVHGIDTLRFILGEVDTVTALVDTLVFGYPVDDTATVLLRFRSGVQGVVSAAFSVASVDEVDYLEVCGTGGRLWTAPLHSKDSRGTLRVSTPAGEQQHAFEQSTHQALIEAFDRSLEHDEPVPVPGEEGLQGLAVVEAAYASARTGRSIQLSGSDSR